MFKDSTIILDAFQWSFLTKSATAAMFTSFRVNFGWPPLSSSSTSSLPSRNVAYHLKMFDQFRASFLQAFCTNASVSVADRPALKQNFTFLPSKMYKENITLQDKLNSYTVEDKQTKLSV